MATRLRLALLDRRSFVVQSAAAAALLPELFRTGSANAAGTAPPDRTTFEQAYAQLTKGAKPAEGKITLEVPEIAENGNVVPFTVTADSPMTAESHVKTIHVLSTENPQPIIATFRFAPESGKASVAGRMRLAKTQDVVVLAELSDGKLWVSRTAVKITIGGCGG